MCTTSKAPKLRRTLKQQSQFAHTNGLAGLRNDSAGLTNYRVDLLVTVRILQHSAKNKHHK